MIKKPIAWTVDGQVRDWSKDFSAYRTQHYVRPVYATPQPKAKPCRSPYCECDVGKCTHPGFYDARHEQPQRTWVGLTEDELKLMAKDDQYSGLIRAVALTVEARLKEKNS